MNIGIASTSWIIDQFIPAALSIEGVSIAGIYSRNVNSTRMDELLDKYPIKNRYDSFDALLGDEEIDFVYIASPNSFHFQQSLLALEAGKNVICEKPLTTTGAEARILLETAQKNNLMIFEAITTIHLPNYKLLKDKIETIAPLRILQLNYSQYSSKYDRFLRGENPNIFNPLFSTGTLQDLNIYNVHFVMGLFGKPNLSVYYPNIRENGIDTSGILIMQYPEFTASLIGSKDTRSDTAVYLQGEKGYMYVKNGSSSCDEVTVYSNDGTKIETFNVQEDGKRFEYEIAEFKRIYDERNYDTCYDLMKYSVSVMEVVEEARKKAGIVFPDDNVL